MKVHQPSSLVKISVIVTFGLLQLACPHTQEPMRAIGPEVKASLVIYFNSDVTNAQVNTFWKEILSRPDPSGRGYNHRKGVGDIGRIPPVQGHEGISISFFPDATSEEREEVIRDIRFSPIVYRVLRDIAPAEVKKLDDLKRTDESTPGKPS